MIFNIALKNFLRQGMRAFLNVMVTAFTMVAVVFNISLYNGFLDQAIRNMVVTDVAGGHYRVPEFDLLSPTEWEDQTFTAPQQLSSLSPSEKAEILVLQGQIFPNRRLFPVQLRGVEMSQTLLDLPFKKLAEWKAPVNDVIPIIIGRQMAEKSHLELGDSVVMKWRDRFGAVDALDVQVVDVVPLINARLDNGVVWLRLDHLRQITHRENEVSWVAVKHSHGDIQDLKFLPPEILIKDILDMIRNDRRFATIIWIILIFLAGISVFNTQYLNVFKRQREIGTLMAFGMPPGRIIRLFTLEGSLAALSAVGVALIFGTIIFTWFQSVGLDVSHLTETNIPVRENIFLKIDPVEVVLSGAIIVAIMIVVSWSPVRKISKLDVTQALRGRAIT
ncbi:MAG: FtsX-like permease family protein [Nitrospinaceae bacterium]|nr:FtsX-like permease family protein [Nitrospinaceae bacterium]NIR57460.1 FtsX-like permease family protein [Nitrospinaceae bacterium]NIS87927.1 FtsX-like permease family protein [Nitrospinaceae bacterium]NIT84795.1 FtsX-like permease family protein [Nitrospinaceae bacterium]NIU46971.1 FtsX-like permease family protein [Nitrospinaceae bacterium]